MLIIAYNVNGLSFPGGLLEIQFVSGMDLRSGQIYTCSGTGRVLHRKQICNQCVLQEVLTCGPCVLHS